MKKILLSLMSVFLLLTGMTLPVHAEEDAAKEQIELRSLDRTELIEVIERAQEVFEKKHRYDQDLIDQLEEHYDMLIEIRDNDVIFGFVDVDQDLIDETVASYKALLEDLVVIHLDKEELKTLIDDAEEKLNETDVYSEESLNALEQVFNTAKNIYDNSEDQDLIDETSADLKEALDNLVSKDERLNRSRLVQVINEANEIIANSKQYLEEEIETLEEYLETANSINENDTYEHPLFGTVDVTQDMIDDTTDKLRDYINSMEVLQFDEKEAINNFIEGAGDLLFDAIFNSNSEVTLFSDMMGQYEEESVGSYDFLVESWEWYDDIASSLEELKSNSTFMGDQALGHILRHENNSNKTVFLAHGYRSNLYANPERHFLAPKAKSFYDEGYNIVFLNAAGHKTPGVELEGDKYINFGIEDRHLYAEILDKYIDLYGYNEDVYLYGESMGAATVLLMLDLDLPYQVRGVVADSSFTNLETLVLTIKNYVNVEGAGKLVIDLIKAELGFIGNLAVNAIGLKDQDTLLEVINKMVETANGSGLVSGAIKDALLELGLNPAIFKHEGVKMEYIEEIFSKAIENFETVIGTSMSEVSPLASITNNQEIPVALMHNKGDLLIPYTMSEELFANSSLDSNNIILKLFEDGNHCTSHSDDHLAHTSFVVDFMEDHKFDFELSVDNFVIGYNNVQNNDEFLSLIQSELPENIEATTNFEDVVNASQPGVYEVEVSIYYKTKTRTVAPLKTFVVEVTIESQDLDNFEDNKDIVFDELKEEDFSSGMWSYIQKALKEITDVADSKNSTQKEIDEASEDLLKLITHIENKVSEEKSSNIKKMRVVYQELFKLGSKISEKDWVKTRSLFTQANRINNDEASKQVDSEKSYNEFMKFSKYIKEKVENENKPSKPEKPTIEVPSINLNDEQLKEIRIQATIELEHWVANELITDDEANALKEGIKNAKTLEDFVGLGFFITPEVPEYPTIEVPSIELNEEQLQELQARATKELEEWIIKDLITKDEANALKEGIKNAQTLKDLVALGFFITPELPEYPTIEVPSIELNEEQLQELQARATKELEEWIVENLITKDEANALKAGIKNAKTLEDFVALGFFITPEVPEYPGDEVIVPEIELTKLKSLVKKAKTFLDGDYTTETLEELKTAINHAELLIVSVEGLSRMPVTQKDIDAAYDRLVAAIDGLQLNNPGTDEPGTDEPGTDEPGTDKPGTDKPGTDKPGTDKPGTDKPGTDKPSTDKPSTDKPGKDTPDTSAVKMYAVYVNIFIIAAIILLINKKKKKA